MATERGSMSRGMFVVGLTMALLAGGLMFFTDIETGPLSLVGIIGILLVATSRVRLL